MKRVTGIGGIVFKAKAAKALQAWYKQHLGIDVQEWGGSVHLDQPIADIDLAQSGIFRTIPPKYVFLFSLFEASGTWSPETRTQIGCMPACETPDI